MDSMQFKHTFHYNTLVAFSQQEGHRHTSPYPSIRFNYFTFNKIISRIYRPSDKTISLTAVKREQGLRAVRTKNDHYNINYFDNAVSIHTNGVL